MELVQACIPPTAVSLVGYVNQLKCYHLMKIVAISVYAQAAVKTFSAGAVYIVLQMPFRCTAKYSREKVFKMEFLSKVQQPIDRIQSSILINYNLTVY